MADIELRFVRRPASFTKNSVTLADLVRMTGVLQSRTRDFGPSHINKTWSDWQDVPHVDEKPKGFVGTLNLKESATCVVCGEVRLCLDTRAGTYCEECLPTED